MSSDAQWSIVPDPAMPDSAFEGAPPRGGGIPASVRSFLGAQNSAPRSPLFPRLFGRNPVPRSLRNQYRIAWGDVAVIEVLSQLGSDWLVRSCDSLDGEGIEHVLVGPSGIFCMIVRHQLDDAIWIDGGVILADGERLPHLRDAEYAAVRLTQMMSDAVGSRVAAAPCLVLTGTRSVSVAKPPRRVAVMRTRDIRAWLKGLSPVLSNEEAVTLRESAAADRDCYVVGEVGSSSALALDEFRKVRSDMIQARHVRLTWVTAALVLLWLIAVVGIGGITTSLLVG